MTYKDAINLRRGDYVKPKKWKDIPYVGVVEKVVRDCPGVTNKYCYIYLHDGGRYFYKDLIKL